MKRLLALFVVVLAAACAPQYEYVPTTNAVATIRGNVAAEYPLPATAPRGDLRIASYGMTDVHPESAPDQTFRALHLRVVLANNGATAWTFDTREQRVALDGVDELPPTFASANAGSRPPLVTVDRSEKRVVDLFFLLPANLQHADAVPEFDAVWRVHTDAGVIAERTPFERLTIEPDEGPYEDWNYGPGYYWGGPYWVNEGYPYAGFPYGYGYFTGGVLIHRSPRFWPGYRGGFYHGVHEEGGHAPVHGGGFHGGGGRGGR